MSILGTRPRQRVLGGLQMPRGISFEGGDAPTGHNRDLDR